MSRKNDETAPQVDAQEAADADAQVALNKELTDKAIADRKSRENA